MTYIGYPGTAGFSNLGQVNQLGGFWSSVKKVAKGAAQVAVLPITASVKTVTAPAKAVGLPGASTADRYVSAATPQVVNKAIDKIAVAVGDATCDALLNKYIAVGAAAGLAVATSGGSLVIAQAGQTVATGACAKRIADEMAKRQAEEAARLAAEQAAAAQAQAILNQNAFPQGTIAYLQPDGLYRVAVPKGGALSGYGTGDLGATTHTEVAIVSIKPSIATDVDKATYVKATTPFYFRTPFLIGVGVAVLAIGGVGYVVRKRRRG